MKKIPTIFERGDHRGDRKVFDKVTPGCEWVFNGEGMATEKLDGTNVRVTVRSGTMVRLEKRRNPTKAQKKAGIVEPWYVDASETDANDKWIFEAAAAFVFAKTAITGWPDGEHCCEAVGPKIQGNPLGLDAHVCVPFNLKPVEFEPPSRDYDAIRDFLKNGRSRYVTIPVRAEGIVFHHPDGRRAKIKLKDFA